MATDKPTTDSPKTALGAALLKIRARIVADRIPLLSIDEILREVALTREEQDGDSDVS